jgi:hypothetical protein
MSKKLGVSKKKTIHASVYEGTVAHQHVTGRAYEFTDATEKLIATIGGGFFNEPKYYDSNRSAAEFYRELLTTGKISSTITDAQGLTEQARVVMEAAQAVASGPNPEDLLVIAAWARDPEKGLKLRYTPQIMLCIAAANQPTRAFAEKYAPAIIKRADEIRHVFAAYRHLFSKKKDGRATGATPLALRRALALALATTKPYSLLKYDSKDRPTFGDVILMCRGQKIRSYLEQYLGELKSWPVDRAMFEYLVNGKIVDDAPEMLKARQQFFTLKKISEVSKDLLDKAGLTWENIVSHFGSSKEVWELCIPYMGEMALTRNLRNFEQAGISSAAWDTVYEKCASISDTRQLPFRFFTASNAATGTEGKSVVGKMLDNSCQNVPGLSGVTAILVDNSGSTRGCRVSGKSEMVVAQAGNMLSAIIAKKVGRKCMVGVFGDCAMWVPFSEADGCLNIMDKIEDIATRADRTKNKALAISDHWKHGSGVGGGTETGLWCALHDLTERKVHVDRIIIVSDFCCYTQGDANNCGHDMNKFFGKDGDKATIQSMLQKYRLKVNKDVWVHSVDLAGHGQKQTKGVDHVQTLSGWSEQVFSIMAAAEAMTEQKAQTGEPVPTIEILRERYRMS